MVADWLINCRPSIETPGAASHYLHRLFFPMTCSTTESLREIQEGGVLYKEAF